MNTPPQRAYTIGLLNDLHSHFPELLYRPERFTSVQDVLAYIGQVASQNPYERNREAYLRSVSSSSSSSTTRPQRMRNPSQPASSSSTSSSQFTIHNLGSAPIETIRYRVPLSAFMSNSSSQASDTLMSSLMGGLLGNHELSDLYRHILQPYANAESNVPTEDEIRRATSIPTVHDIVEGTCSICQDQCVQEGPMCRRIDHCGHLFHRDCIDTWFRSHSTCPMCRYDIRRND
jgi:hypothetical protein